MDLLLAHLVSARFCVFSPFCRCLPLSCAAYVIEAVSLRSIRLVAKMSPVLSFDGQRQGSFPTALNYSLLCLRYLCSLRASYQSLSQILRELLMYLNLAMANVKRSEAAQNTPIFKT